MLGFVVVWLWRAAEVAEGRLENKKEFSARILFAFDEKKKNLFLYFQPHLSYLCLRYNTQSTHLLPNSLRQ